MNTQTLKRKQTLRSWFTLINAKKVVLAYIACIVIDFIAYFVP